MQIIDFDNQSELVIEFLMERNKMNREDAKSWYKSKTYSEILDRKLFYISATRAYSELLMERAGNDEWMRNSFEL